MFLQPLSTFILDVPGPVDVRTNFFDLSAILNENKFYFFLKAEWFNG